jgi:ABC-type dipeptide/oligopeptide/nickel transport system ATPase component
MIAMALMGDPELLIADEPTTRSTSPSRRQILRLLGRSPARARHRADPHHHDLGSWPGSRHRVGVMYAGEVVEAGSAERCFATRATPIRRAS